MNCKMITENDCAVSAVLSCSPAEFLIINKVISRCSTNEDFAESDRKTMALMGKAMMNFEQVEVADTQQTTSTPYCVNTSSVCKVDTPQTEQMKTADYCDICKQDMCEDCIADATNPYCVPSHYEINYEPKDEPKTQMKTQNSNLTFEKVIKEIQTQEIEFPDTHQKFIFARKIERDGDCINIYGWEYKGVKGGEREGE